MRAALAILLLAFGLPARAHIGSPNVFVEGAAGPYPVRVVIRPPNVVPGLAEISVRVPEGNADQVSALPVYWNAGRKGAPRPDIAKLVRGETNLYSATLWLMKSGAYSVDVNVTGPRGTGTLIIPVNASATNTKPMSGGFALMLAALGLVLFAGAVKMAGALFGESFLNPGQLPARKDIWRGRIAMALGFIVAAGALFGGKRWWEFEERDYRNNTLYKRAPVLASVREAKDQFLLDLSVDLAKHRGRWTRLMPDHGKMMHLFVIQEGGLNAFAHLHPVAKGNAAFEAPLPPLPAGKYHLYADVTHENGFSETLTAEVNLPAPSPAAAALWASKSGEPVCSSAVIAKLQTILAVPPDPDDSWHADRESPKASAGSQALAVGAPRIADLSGGYRMLWLPPSTLAENAETSLRFKLVQPNGETAPLEPYMGMAGHAAIRREDGSVFSHLHPSGNFSMASRQFFEARAEEDGTNKIKGTDGTNEGGSQASLAGSTNHTQHASLGREIVSFPYEFPRSGPYRIWAQLKSKGEVFTGVFEAEVAAR